MVRYCCRNDECESGPSLCESISPPSVSENSTAAIVTVTATDADADDNITGYAISGGADQAKFSIVSSTGALSFQEAPNFENPTDVQSTTPVNAAGNNEYIVIVSATSGTECASLDSNTDDYSDSDRCERGSRLQQQ